jgi:UDP-N-acetylmuramoyl-tripeptide--D-alanyl-D-alanine ligase
VFFPDAAKILASNLYRPEPSSKINGASIDTRTIQPGNLFVALPGTQTDGHQFLKPAFEKGASGAIVQDKYWQEHGSAAPSSWKNIIPAADPAAAFLNLAAAYRNSFALTAIGVVGSVGKTSTKEFLHYLLRQKFPVLATEGNLNNHLGLPLTLFKLNSLHQFCVCELGTNRIGDVQQLAAALKPDCGLLTRIAPEHLEGFGSLDNVYEGELELFRSLRPGSAAVIPDDDPLLLEKIKGLNLRWYRVGMTPQAAYRLSEVRTDGIRVHFKVNGYPFSFPGVATFLARNAAIAAAMAEISGLPLEKMPSFWRDFTLPAGRFQEQVFPPGIRVIYDGYNASPASFDAALQTFEEMSATGRKILVFSDMLELGTEEKKYHEALGKRIVEAKLDGAIAYGPRARWSVDAIRRGNPQFSIEYVENQREAAGRLEGRLKAGDVLLLKASRSMKIEDVLNYLFDSKPVLH